MHSGRLRHYLAIFVALMFVTYVPAVSLTLPGLIG